MLKYQPKYLNLIIVSILLLIVLVIYFLLACQISNSYLPVWNDEFFYYTNAASFFENTTLQAAVTYNGTGSRLLGADAHSFAYPLLNGGIAKIFGWGHLNFIYTNFFFVAASFVWILMDATVTLLNKLLIILFVLLFPFFAIYGFTYMQESIHIFFAMTCSFLIYKIHTLGKRKYYSFFILVVFVAALFRPFWLVWLVGLIPFAVNKFQRRSFILLFLLGGLLSILLMYFFSEYVPNYFASVIALAGKGKFAAFFYSIASHFTYNGYAYFFKNDNSLVYLFVKCSMLTVFIFFVIKAYKRNLKLFISIALIGFFNFFALFLLYDVFMWREVRVLVSFFYFCIPFMIFEINNHFKFLLLFMLVLFFGATLSESKRTIAERNIHSKIAIAESQKAFGEIAKKVNNNATILVNYYPSDSTLDLINFPVKNISNSPIRYIVPYYRVKKTGYEYVLNSPGATPQGTVLVSNLYFQLEKVK